MKQISFNKISYLLEKIASMLGGFRFKMINDKGHYKGPGMDEYKPFCKGGHSKKDFAVVLKDNMATTYTFTESYEVVFFIAFRAGTRTCPTFTLSKYDSSSPSSTKACTVIHSRPYTSESTYMALSGTTNVFPGVTVTTTGSYGFYIYGIPKGKYIRANLINSGIAMYRSSDYSDTVYSTFIKSFAGYDNDAVQVTNYQFNNYQAVLLYVGVDMRTPPTLEFRYNGEVVNPIYYAKTYGRCSIMYIAILPRLGDYIQVSPVTEAMYKNQNAHLFILTAYMSV